MKETEVDQKNYSSRAFDRFLHISELIKKSADLNRSLQPKYTTDLQKRFEKTAWVC